MKDILGSLKNFRYVILISVVTLLIVVHCLFIFIEASYTKTFVTDYSERIASQLDEAATSINVFQLKNLLSLLKDDRISFLIFQSNGLIKNGYNGIHIGTSGESGRLLNIEHEIKIEYSGHEVGTVRFVIDVGALSILVLKKYLWIYSVLGLLFLMQSLALSFAPVLIIRRIERFLFSLVSMRKANHGVDEMAKQIDLNIELLGNSKLLPYKGSVLAEISKMIINLLNIEIDYTRSQVTANLAKQVSHDVRSPLSALNSILGQLTQIPEQQRIIIRSSVNRINDIANQLLEKGKQSSTAQSGNAVLVNNEKPILKVELLSPIIDSLISEKRTQFREKQGVEIDADINQGYGLFAKINATEFKRVLSNLTNNSVEALPDGKGKFAITISERSDTVIVTAQDNGKGIPRHILDKLGQMGVTHGKEGTQSGSGLGVYHAKKTIESFGGSFEIKSVEGAGTTIVMTFPKSTAPTWFVELLQLKPQQQIVSLDDDLSIHQVWLGRFQSRDLPSQGIQHLTFTSGQEFKDWFTEPSNKSASRLYLMDYELLNQKHTGLEIIEELGIGSSSILVTSRYEEPHIREKCEKLGVRLIPKSMASFVPIEIEKPKELLDCCLIDDDIELMHTCWAMAAEGKGKKFKAYAKAEEFFKAASSLDSRTPIYVDSNLGDGVKGEDVSKKIYEMGFKEIYLCTGYQASDFPEMPWLKGIKGKDAPF